MSRKRKVIPKYKPKKVALDLPYLSARGITGEPISKNRVHRASDDCWKFGISDPRMAYTEDSQGYKTLNTIKITKNGITTVVTSNDARRKRKPKVTVNAHNRIVQDRKLHEKLGSNHI